MRPIYLLFGLLSLFMISAHAQNYTLSGKITEKDTGESLYGASFYIEGANLGTTTNEYGFYSLSVPKGQYVIRIQYLGFKPIRRSIIVDKDIHHDYALISDAQTLDAVEVTANTPKADVQIPQMSTNKIALTRIKQLPVVLGEVDIIKSLLLLPGVTNAGEGASGFNVRGGASDQNLILLDEAILYNASHLFGFFGVFNADAIRDITLYKGGIPSRYGGRVSSVLDIYQKEGNKNEYKATGGIGLLASRLLVEGPLKKGKSSFLVSGRSSYVHLFLKLFNNDNSAYFYDLNAKLSYEINRRNKLYFSSYFGRDKFSIAKTIKNEYGNSLFNLRWNHIISDKLFSNLSLIYSDYYYGLDLELVGFRWTSTIKNINMKYDLRHYLSDHSKLSYGAQAIYSIFNPGHIEPLGEDSKVADRNIPNKYSLETAAYMGLEQKITSKLTLMAGLRYSHYFRFGPGALNLYENNQPVGYSSSQKRYFEATPIDAVEYDKWDVIDSFRNFEPRLSLSYVFAPHQSVKASYNRMAQYMQLISNTTSSTPLDIWAPADRYLKPLILNQYAVGYASNLQNNTYSLEVEAFYKSGKNRLDYIDGADLVANAAIEREILLGHMRSYGLEVLLRKNLGRLTGTVAYTLSRAEQQVKGRTPEEVGINDGDWYKSSYDKTHDISISGLYKLNQQWTFGANFILQSGLPITYPQSKYDYAGLKIPNYARRNENLMPAYHRLDISATFRPKSNQKHRWQSEWVFGIYNIYNRMNAYSIIFRQNKESGSNEAVRLSIFGIVPSVTYNFKF